MLNIIVFKVIKENIFVLIPFAPCCYCFNFLFTALNSILCHQSPSNSLSSLQLTSICLHNLQVCDRKEALSPHLFNCLLRVSSHTVKL